MHPCHAHVPLCMQKQPFKSERCDLMHVTMDGLTRGLSVASRAIAPGRQPRARTRLTISTQGMCASYVTRRRGSKADTDRSQPH